MKKINITQENGTCIITNKPTHNAVTIENTKFYISDNQIKHIIRELNNIRPDIIKEILGELNLEMYEENINTEEDYMG